MSTVTKCLIVQVDSAKSIMMQVLLDTVDHVLRDFRARGYCPARAVHFKLNMYHWLAVVPYGDANQIDTDLASLQTELNDTLGLTMHVADYIDPSYQDPYLVSPSGTLSIYTHNNHSDHRNVIFYSPLNLELPLPLGKQKVVKPLKQLIMAGEHNSVRNMYRYAKYHLHRRGVLGEVILDGLVKRRNPFRTSLLALTHEMRLIDISSKPTIPVPLKHSVYAQRRLGFYLAGYEEFLYPNNVFLNDFSVTISPWEKLGLELHNSYNTTDGIAYI